MKNIVRNWIKILLVIICLCIVITANAQTKILPLGDSITQAKQGHNSYRRALWKKLKNSGYEVDFIGSQNTVYPHGNPLESDYDLDHEGHWGWRIDEIINGRAKKVEDGKLTDWLEIYTPDIVLILLGTNDAKQNQSVFSSVEEFKIIIDLLRKDNPNVVILLAKITPLKKAKDNEKIIALNKAIQGIAETKSTSQSPVIIVDQYSEFSGATDTYDGVHPNPVGEEKLATKWFISLKKLLNKPIPTVADTVPLSKGVTRHPLLTPDRPGQCLPREAVNTSM